MNKIEKIYNLLLNEHGEQGWWPLYNPKTGHIEYHKGNYDLPKNDQQRFEIIIGAILTQNTSWKNVEKALKNLIKYKLLNRKALEKIPVKKLAKIIKSSGYHNQKARKIKEFIKFKGAINRESLLGIWGIGNETADSILLYSYRKPVFVVDAYTKRIFNRIGFKEQSYNDLQKLFMKNLKKDCRLFNEFHALIVEHGKRICRKDPLCEKCCLRNLCNYDQS